MNLYQLSEEYKKALSLAMKEAKENDGELSDIAVRKITDLEMSLTEKIENTIKFIKNLRSEADSLWKEEQSLKSRRDKKTSTASRLENWLQINSITEYECTAGIVSSRRSTVIDIDLTEADIPEKYLSIKTSPDKAELKKAIKRGEDIKGVRLIEKLNTRVK